MPALSDYLGNSEVGGGGGSPLSSKEGLLLYKINFQKNMSGNSFPCNQATFQEQKVCRGKGWLRQ